MSDENDPASIVENDDGVDLSDFFDTMDAEAVNINYSDEAEIDDDAERICLSGRCSDHADGDDPCPVPETWGELRNVVDEHENLKIPTDRRQLDLDEDVYRDPSAYDHDLELDEQAVPSGTVCPYCGGDPEPSDSVKHRLSAMGYTHDDVEMTCSECDASWPLGIPIGEYDGKRAQELYCDSCTDRYMLVHRVEPKTSDSEDDPLKVLLHLKCPNCYYFKRVARGCGRRGISLVGYPQITGDTDGAHPDGYVDGDV